MLRDFLSIAFFFLIFQSYAAAQQTKTGGYYPADYQIQDSIPIKTPDGPQISAMVVRKKGVTEKQSAILSFTIYAGLTDIKKLRLQTTATLAWWRGGLHAREALQSRLGETL